MYEIKPISNYYNVGLREEAHAQRNAYIVALEQDGKDVNKKGTTFDPNGYTVYSDLYDCNIRYYTFWGDEGMIYYSYVNKPKQEEVLVKEKEEADLKRVAKGIAEGAGIVAGGYILYRIIRMIPSLFPPLWWTAPINAACP